MPGSILLIDDDIDTLTVFKAILDIEGYTVYTAENLDEAIATVKRHEIDLAIIDFVFPGCRGDLMARVLKLINEKLEIIFLSGHESVFEAVGRLDFPVYETFMKPENIDELLLTIRGIFEGGGDPRRGSVPSGTRSCEIREL